MTLRGATGRVSERAASAAHEDDDDDEGALEAATVVGSFPEFDCSDCVAVGAVTAVAEADSSSACVVDGGPDKDTLVCGVSLADGASRTSLGPCAP